MELTGARRTIHIMLFATVAWAGLLLLVLWSWRGGLALGLYTESAWDPRAKDFAAGNALTAVIAFMSLVIVTGALRTPTFDRSRRACWLLCALIPLVAYEAAFWYLDVHHDLPQHIYYTSSGIAVRTAMGVIAASGLVLVPTIGFLFALEERCATRPTLPPIRVRT